MYYKTYLWNIFRKQGNEQSTYLFHLSLPKPLIFPVQLQVESLFRGHDDVNESMGEEASLKCIFSRGKTFGLGILLCLLKKNQVSEFPGL